MTLWSQAAGSNLAFNSGVVIISPKSRYIAQRSNAFNHLLQRGLVTDRTLST
jgi:hypothetical protein